MTNRTKISGFTIIEVLISISILVGAIITISSVWSGNTLRIRKSRLFNEVGFLLERKVAEIELKFEGKDLSSIPEELSGDFGEKFKNYLLSWACYEKRYNRSII